MAELVILGSGSGFATQERFFASIALLSDPHLYLFDCGEPCAALLFRSGIDVLALKTIFLSHLHADHVTGLGGLLSHMGLLARNRNAKSLPWSIHRNADWYRAAISFPARTDPGTVVAETRPQFQLVLPSEAIAPIEVYLKSLGLSPATTPFDYDLLPVREGLAYSDEHILVTALMNTHLSSRGAADLPEARRQSYSFAVEAAGVKFIYSGDVGSLDELNPLLRGANLLIVEVAHYDPTALGPFVRDLPLRRIVLTHIHPGLEEQLKALVKKWGDPRIEIAHDGMHISLDREKLNMKVHHNG